ncbi:MAG: aminoglycoside phosphotransferase family protein [Planctomycetes bacterium]|nr:aminoglycoside phosphotransferase family protein [Planctomycetota bacterium]
MIESKRQGDGGYKAPEELGDQFEPLLREACHERLGPIAWFRADWQRGGAKTGRSTYDLGEHGPVPVVVKIPIGPNEFLWHHRLQPRPGQSQEITSRLYASDTILGGYDLAWIVTERFSEGPLLGLVREDAIDLMSDAAARFHALASAYPITGKSRREDWALLIERARENVQTNSVWHEQKWTNVLKRVARSLDKLVELWRARRCDCWCHGDLHPANAMSRSNDAEDPAMLIDLAEVHVGHWVEDAVYLERMFWLRPGLLEDRPPVQQIATRRKDFGLTVEPEDHKLADVRRILLAATAPAFLRTEGNPRYLDACLNVCDEALGRIL